MTDGIQIIELNCVGYTPAYALDASGSIVQLTNTGTCATYDADITPDYLWFEHQSRFDSILAISVFIVSMMILLYFIKYFFNLIFSK